MCNISNLEFKWINVCLIAVIVVLKVWCRFIYVPILSIHVIVIYLDCQWFRCSICIFAVNRLLHINNKEWCILRWIMFHGVWEWGPSHYTFVESLCIIIIQKWSRSDTGYYIWYVKGVWCNKSWYILNNYGIRGLTNDWFRSYLSDREQFVDITGVN